MQTEGLTEAAEFDLALVLQAKLERLLGDLLLNCQSRGLRRTIPKAITHLVDDF